MTDLQPGESMTCDPLELREGEALAIEATCPCGGKVAARKNCTLKLGMNRIELVCERSRWWNRRRHAHLTAEISVGQKP